MIFKKYISTAALVTFFLPLTVFAQGGVWGVSAPGTVTLTSPLGSKTLCGFIKDVINLVLALGVPVAVLFVVGAGFMLVFARGNPAELTKAKRNLAWVLIGIGVFLGAWVLGQIIANTINAIAQGGGVTFSINSCI